MNFTSDAVSGGAKQLLFRWLEFTLFILILMLSTVTRIHFGSWGKTEITPTEYQHGGRDEYYSGRRVSCGQASTVTDD
jgi:hypothetical protein